MTGFDNKYISVVIATHDRPEKLRRAITNCLAQSYKNVSIIVVDNAARIETKTIIESCGNSRRIFLIQDNAVQSPTYARNIGWRHARKLGIQWVFFLDDDDVFTHDRSLEKLIRVAVGDEVILVYGIQRDVDAKGNVLAYNNRHIHELNDFFLDYSIGRISFPAKAVLWNTNFLYLLGGFNKKYHDAYEEIGLVLEAFIYARKRGGKIIHLNESVADWCKFGPGGVYMAGLENGAQQASRLLIKKRIIQATKELGSGKT